MLRTLRKKEGREMERGQEEGREGEERTGRREGSSSIKERQMGKASSLGSE